jgi:hypothetical protein
MKFYTLIKKLLQFRILQIEKYSLFDKPKLHPDYKKQ